MDYKRLFDLPDDIIYLNTPGNGLMPSTHHAWRQKREIDFFNPNGTLREEQGEFIANVKTSIGSLFHCATERLYCTPNFSFAFNTLIEGLALDLTFLLLNEDYPSLNYPIISRGFRRFFVDADEHIEQHIRQGIIDHNPDIVLLSIVQYISGLKIDLNFVKKIKEEFPTVLIIADGTQFLGTEPFDFDNSGFDAVGTSGYKWLMAGFGNGFMMISEQLASKIYATAQSRPRPQEAMWAKKSILDTYFEPGHQDTLSHGTLQQSVHLLRDLGLDNVQHHIQQLSAYAYDQLIARDLILPAVHNRTVRSSLINMQVPQQLYPTLLTEGLKCFPRGKGIRIGIHINNDQKDIENLIELIDKYI